MAWYNFISKSNSSYHEHAGRHESRANSNSERIDRPASKAIIYRSELDYISRCILDYPSIETGGQLFGYWTALGVPVVLYAIGPGRKAKHNPTSFIQDQDYLQEIGHELHRKFRLQHIGEWHSHHQLDLAQPSGGDVNTMQYGVGKPGFPRLLLCIGNCTPSQTTINAFNFHENTPREYIHAMWDIVETDSPYRRVADEELRHMLIHPNTRRASHTGLYTNDRNSAKNSDIAPHWLMEKPENVETMKAFMNEISTLCSDSTTKAVMLSSGEPAISFNNGKNHIKLPHGFPYKSPELYSVDDFGNELKCALDEDIYSWNIYSEDLVSAFKHWASPLFSKEQEQCDSATQCDTPTGSPAECSCPECQEEPLETAPLDNGSQAGSTISMYKDILREKLPTDAWAWNESAEGTDIYMLAYPVITNQQIIAKMSLRQEQAPEVKIAIHYINECMKALPTDFDKLEYIELDDGLFYYASAFHAKMNAWEKYKSIYRSYLAICLLLNQHKNNINGDMNAYEKLKAMSEDEQLLNMAMKDIERICLTN